MLRKDVEPGNPGQTGSRAYIRGFEIAGKTGTTQRNNSVAFVGYTPEIAASVMVFNPKEEENVGGFGGGKGATIWRDAMAPILTARGSGAFPPADPTVVRGNTVPVPGCSSVSNCRSVLTAAGFQTATVKTDSDKEDGALVGTSPPRGGRAVIGQLVTILVSNGSDFVPEPPPAPSPAPGPAPGPEPPVLPPEEGVPTLPAGTLPDFPEPGEDWVVPAWPPRQPRGGGGG
jgi:membrane peptidoglycan carboxypeptidase